MSFTLPARYAVLSLYIVLSAGFVFAYQKDCLFFLSLEEVVESEYPGTPFALSGKVADYIRTHSQPGDRICMVAAEPQLFFLSQRRSASGYIYIYPLLENQKYAGQMTAEFIARSEQLKPAILVYASKSLFEEGYDHNGPLYRWFDGYKKQYKLEAICTTVNAANQHMSIFNTINPVDTLPEAIPQIRVYKRI